MSSLQAKSGNINLGCLEHHLWIQKCNLMDFCNLSKKKFFSLVNSCQAHLPPLSNLRAPTTTVKESKPCDCNHEFASRRIFFELQIAILCQDFGFRMISEMIAVQET